MTTKSSNISLGFNSYLLKEQKNLNTIPIAAGARLQPRAFLDFREPFSRVNKRPGHHFRSPELLHGHCRIPVLVASTSPGLVCAGISPCHLSLSEALQRQFLYLHPHQSGSSWQSRPQHPPKALENLTRHVHRNTALELVFESSEWFTKISKRDRKPKRPIYLSAPGSWEQGDPLQLFFSFLQLCFPEGSCSELFLAVLCMHF